jgi:GTP-binding protein
VVADIPGLIEGASQGKGLGHQFLRHVERARVLCLMLDLASPHIDGGDGVDPGEQERVLLHELGEYQPDLLDRPRIVLGTKADLVPDADAFLAEQPGRIVVSAVTGDGVRRAVGAMASAVHEARENEERQEGVVLLRPQPTGAKVERVAENEYRIVGRDVERVVALNDVSTFEATAYISHRLERLGVDKLLSKAGAQDGDVVWIGTFSFEYRGD